MSLSLRLVLVVALAAATSPAQHDPSAGCRTCHPGPTRDLAASIHGALLQRAELRGAACTGCHGELRDHAASARRPLDGPRVQAPAVARSACASCHPGRDLATKEGAHPGQPTPRPDTADDRLLAELERQDEGSAIAWRGLVTAGVRFVARHGSHDRFASDIDLDSGPRLRLLELIGTGEGNAALDHALLRIDDVGDPTWGVEASAERADAFAIEARHRRSSLHYRSSGDWHRVDRDRRDTSGEVGIELGADWRLIADHRRLDEDGFWLTNRIGSRSLTPQTTISGVESPRHLAADESMVGVQFGRDGLRALAAVDWLDQRSRDRWTFARPATADPAFVEAEDMRSSGALRGPGGRLAVGQTTGPLAFDVTGRYRHLRRDLTGTGSASGFDIAPFTTSTDAEGSGTARTWLLDGDATLELDDRLALIGDLHWRDHAEDLALRQTDSSTFPTLGTTTVVTTAVRPRTAQRLLEGSLELELEALPGLDLSVGYGFAVEAIRVPTDPAAGGSLAGTVRNDGVLAGLRWRPDAHWTARLRGQDFGQDGLALHEQVADRARRLEASLTWQNDTLTVTSLVKWRRASNPLSRYHLESTSAGVDVSWRHPTFTREQPTFDLHASYLFARTDSRTLTNFYFDPDPTPVPTFVGFDGDTHTLGGGLLVHPAPDWRWDLAASWTTTTGSFDVTFVDWQTGLRWQATTTGAAGIEFRQVRYDEAAGLDDYGAELVFVYWQQAF